MHLSKVHRERPLSMKRVFFAEFDHNDALPQGSWVADADEEFAPEAFTSEAFAPELLASAAKVAACVLPSDGRSAASNAAAQAAQLQEAFERGRRQGLEEARERFEAAGERLDAASEALGLALEEISRLRTRLLQGSRGDMLRLVLAIAQQVVGVEVSVNRDAILTTIDRALREAVRSDAYQIRVHPDDLLAATERKPLFLASISTLKNIIFHPDPAITRGGCLVESELGEVDATIEQQLAELRRVLLSDLEPG